MKPPLDVNDVTAKPKGKPKVSAQERSLRAIERLAADVAALKQRASESGAANEDALKKIDLELAHMSREIAVIKDGLTSTVLIAALIERLIERLGD